MTEPLLPTIGGLIATGVAAVAIRVVLARIQEHRRWLRIRAAIEEEHREWLAYWDRLSDALTTQDGGQQ